jgi:hypothetical protein
MKLLITKVEGFMFKNLFTPENHPYNKALKIYRELGNTRNLNEFGQQITEIIGLATEAIKQNKNDGDSHILMADAYKLFGIRLLSEITEDRNEANESRWNLYMKSIFYSAAVIYHWKITPMYSKEKALGEEIYNDVTKIINDLNDIFAKNNMKIVSLSGLHQELYERLISSITN